MEALGTIKDPVHVIVDSGGSGGGGGSLGTLTNPNYVHLDASNVTGAIPVTISDANLNVTVGTVLLDATYNSTPPTVSNGSNSALQIDINGNLKTACTNFPAKQSISLSTSDITGNVPVTFTNSSISITGSTIANTAFGVSSLGNISITGASLPVTQTGSASTTINAISTSTTSATITSNANRKATTIYNDSSAILYLLFGSGTASSTNFTTKLNPAATLTTQGFYTGNISGVLASGTGTARVTEFN